jgi:hypothetical protein
MGPAMVVASCKFTFLLLARPPYCREQYCRQYLHTCRLKPGQSIMLAVSDGSGRITSLPVVVRCFNPGTKLSDIRYCPSNWTIHKKHSSVSYTKVNWTSFKRNTSIQLVHRNATGSRKDRYQAAPSTSLRVVAKWFGALWRPFRRRAKDGLVQSCRSNFGKSTHGSRCGVWNGVVSAPERNIDEEMELKQAKIW